MRFVGERRALAAIIFAFYFLLYLVNALAGAPPALIPALLALAGVYGLACFSLVAGYFWARWYAVGVGLFGIITGAVGLWQIGADEMILFIGGTHLLATLLLWGAAMSEGYDGQAAWREKFHMDDNAVQRLGRAVIRAGVSLPFVLLYALAPRAESLVLSVAVLALTGLGLRGLIRLRTWGVLALGGAGALMLSSAAGEALAHHAVFAVRPAIAGVLLLSVAATFARPMVRLLVRPA